MLLYDRLIEELFVLKDSPQEHVRIRPVSATGGGKMPSVRKVPPQTLSGSMARIQSKTQKRGVARRTCATPPGRKRQTPQRGCPPP